MKSAIHPKTQQITITCNSCNTSFQVSSTLADNFNLDVCNNCHPFFTGTQKIVDTANKARDFENRKKAAENLQQRLAEIKAKKATRAKNNAKSVAGDNSVTNLRDMLKSMMQDNK